MFADSPLSPDLETDSLCAALDVGSGPELISIVGGGGKSALLFGLGAALPGRTLLTTTTRIFATQTARAEHSCCFGTPEFERAMRAETERLLVIGEVDGEKAKGVDREVAGILLATPGVDFVVVEADGSRMRPTKAPAPHEPVVPRETSLFIVVAGIDALSGPISATCHRPERVAACLGVAEDAWLTPASLAKLLCDPEVGLKGVPRDARSVVWLNKIETPSEWAAGRDIAARLRGAADVERVVLGALEPGRRSSDGDASRPDGRRFEVWLA